MPRKKITNVETVKVTARSKDDAKRVGRNADEMITIACHLTFDLRFDDIPDGKGGFKSIAFPSINADLRGKPSGVLLGSGNSVAVTMPKKDWEAVVRVHGRERVFTGWNGLLPCLIPLSKGNDEFKSREQEFEGQVDGFEPADPTAEGVQEATN